MRSLGTTALGRVAKERACPPEDPLSHRTRRRVAFYSHDTQGLGHVRRNIELASAMIAAHPATDVLLIGSATAAARLALPPSTRLVVLPGVTKDRRGGYAAARLDMTLDEVIAVRSDMAAVALRSFAPDVFVVDKLARGLGGELDQSLRVLADSRGPGGARPRVVLGLRDVLDRPGVARAEWDAALTTETLMQHYDEVWVYGDPQVYDPVREYDLPRPVGAMVHYTGYLADGRGGLEPTADMSVPSTSMSTARTKSRPYVLCLVGGGQDGAGLARTFAATPVPAGHDAVLVTGPYMDAAQRGFLHGAADHRLELTVHMFLDDPASLIHGAAAIVSMGGYNTVCEVLASRRPGLVVPRVRPRMEQAIRLDRLSRLTHLEQVHPERATPARIAAWLRDAVRRPHHPHHPHAVDLDGLATVPVLLEDLLSRSAAPLEVGRASA
ncbi:MAG: Mlr3248 protein [uncultured Nocardioidaceae bacterium]|uniref:Mlr3248 protein n=1 Tax=uncultured Nocardioidaceae bacterium TaxID=253824 RepID=A0A6J4N9Q2_9ACTN|nr:MAG: Mlr3248 protein [uncultured Nocardioidaceae bacterium]